MLIKIIIFSIICLNLHASTEIKGTYYVDERKINSSIITKDAKNSFTILSIDKNSHIEKIKSTELLKLLSKHGYKDYYSKNSYVSFVLKSPIDTSNLKSQLEDYYKKKYKHIEIKDILIEPRSYMTNLPKEYILELRNRDFLSKDGILGIKTQDNKKIFFDYSIKATVLVYISKSIIKKDIEISYINALKKRVILDKFRDIPIQDIENTTLQAKRHIPKNKILTLNDVELLNVVKKNSMINVNMLSSGIAITFSAKALQDGKVNDIINVQNSNEKILKVRVIGNNIAEVE